MKAPNECANMEDIRAEIDRIDQDVIALMGVRFQYVQAAAKFKKSRESVKAPERFVAMLRQRRGWAEQAGLSPDVIEKMYCDLVEYFINEEMTKWKAEKD
ncbi:MAG: isochorismate lyase [Candidatus Poribacteria bacterium]|nr:isochorismate lyase [Candidatus Poribacteria bacterium]